MEQVLSACSQGSSSGRGVGGGDGLARLVLLVLQQPSQLPLPEQQLQQLLSAAAAQVQDMGTAALLQLASATGLAAPAAAAAAVERLARAAAAALSEPGKAATLAPPEAARLLELLRSRGQQLPAGSTGAIVEAMGSSRDPLGTLEMLEESGIALPAGWLEQHSEQLAAMLAEPAAAAGQQRPEAGSRRAARTLSLLLRLQNGPLPGSVLLAAAAAAFTPAALADLELPLLASLAAQMQQQQVQLQKGAAAALAQHLQQAAGPDALAALGQKQLAALANAACGWGGGRGSSAAWPLLLQWLASIEGHLTGVLPRLELPALMGLTQLAHQRSAASLAAPSSAAPQLTAALFAALDAADSALISRGLPIQQVVAALWAATSGGSNSSADGGGLGWLPHALAALLSAADDMPPALAGVLAAADDLALEELQVVLQGALLLQQQLQRQATGELSIFPLAAPGEQGGAQGDAWATLGELAAAAQGRLDECSSAQQLAELATQLFRLGLPPDEALQQRLQQQLAAEHHLLSSSAAAGVLFMLAAMRSAQSEAAAREQQGLAHRLCATLCTRAARLGSLELLSAAWAMAQLECSPTPRFGALVGAVLEDKQLMAQLDADSLGAVAWAVSRVEALRMEGRLVGLVRQVAAQRRPLAAQLLEEIAAGLGAAAKGQQLDQGDRQQLMQGLWACALAGSRLPDAGGGGAGSVDAEVGGSSISGGGIKGKGRGRGNRQQQKGKKQLRQQREGQQGEEGARAGAGAGAGAAAREEELAAVAAAQQVPDLLFCLQLLCQALDCKPPPPALQQLGAAVQGALRHIPLQSALQLYTLIESMGHPPSKPQVRALLLATEGMLDCGEQLAPNQLAALLRLCSQSKVGVPPSPQEPPTRSPAPSGSSAARCSAEWGAPLALRSTLESSPASGKLSRAACKRKGQFLSSRSRRCCRRCPRQSSCWRR
jgi:hypothetical protein